MGPIAWGALLVSGLLVALALRELLRQTRAYRATRTWQGTQGVVIWAEATGSTNHTRNRVKVAYQAADGQQYQQEARHDPAVLPQVGQQVSVSYDPAHPEAVVLVSHGGSTEFYLAMRVISLAVSVGVFWFVAHVIRLNS